MTDKIKKKIFTRVPLAIDEKITQIAGDYNTTKSAIIGMLISIGLNYFKAITNPEELISSEKMADVLKEAQKKGVEFKSLEELDDYTN